MARHYEECKAKTDLEWELAQHVKEYIQEEAAKDPYYALATAVLHGAPVDYGQAQPFVEEVVRRGPYAWLDPQKNSEFLSTPRENEQGVRYRYAYYGAKAIVLAEASECYIHNREMGMNDRDAALNCPNMRPPDFRTKRAERERTYRLIKGMGRKGINLMREYLGDDQVVAFDRQVCRYAQKNGWIPSKPVNCASKSIPERQQAEGEEFIKRMAAECGMKPAELQVAAWLWGACRSRAEDSYYKRGRTPNVWLGPSKTIRCNDRARYYRMKGQEPP